MIIKLPTMTHSGDSKNEKLSYGCEKKIWEEGKE